jgi:hypothetical protein
MTSVLRAALVLSAGAVTLAWMVSRRRTDYLPVALLLSLGLVDDVARYALAVFVLAPAHALVGAAPLEGWARFAGHADTSLFLAWPAALAAAALVTFDPAFEGDLERRDRRRRRVLLAVAGSWALVVALLAVNYPVTRGPMLARCYLAAELVGLLVGIGAIATWVPARRWPEIWHVAIALVVAGELASALAGPWRVDLFGSWSLAQVSHALLLAVLIVLQGGLLWISSSPR